VDITETKEPVRITAGETVDFVRSLGTYSAADGWSLLYEGRGGGSVIEWQSVPAADGVSHQITVPAATTENYLPGDYDLDGYALNGATGERKRFYSNILLVKPDLQGQQPDAAVQTHAQKMLASVEDTLEQMAKHDLNDSSTEGVEMRRKRVEELRDLRDHYLRERENELQKAAALAGRPSRKKVRMRLNVTGSAAGASQFGAGSNQLIQ
jgi:hypothetical protein